MAVELQELYEAVQSSYDIKLRTKSCYGKSVDWVHMVEETEFIPLLHGGELALNSGINHHSDAWLFEMINKLNEKGVGGLILSVRDNSDISQEIIDYCDTLRFPFFTTAWKTPYVEIMRIFSGILLKNNEVETTLTEALKNAILYPENNEVYRVPFEKNGFFENMVYHIAVVGGEFSHVEKKIKLQMKRCITGMVDEELVILLAGYQKDEVLDELNKICKNKKNVCVGLGSTVNRMKEIHVSFQNAMLAYKLTNPNSDCTIMDYENLGVYKIIMGVKEQNVCDAFVEEVLGKLIEYDRNNKVPLLQVLEAYFENECSIVQTADALYIHVNTMKYKLAKIKEILGYDILCNENRTRIMLALYIMKLKKIKELG